MPPTVGRESTSRPLRRAACIVERMAEVRTSGPVRSSENLREVDALTEIGTEAVTVAENGTEADRRREGEASEPRGRTCGPLARRLVPQPAPTRTGRRSCWRCAEEAGEPRQESSSSVGLVGSQGSPLVPLLVPLLGPIRCISVSLGRTRDARNSAMCLECL